jgi:hypothetical protein
MSFSLRYCFNFWLAIRNPSQNNLSPVLGSKTDVFRSDGCDILNRNAVHEHDLDQAVIVAFLACRPEFDPRSDYVGPALVEILLGRVIYEYVRFHCHSPSTNFSTIKITGFMDFIHRPEF